MRPERDPAMRLRLLGVAPATGVAAFSWSAASAVAAPSQQDTTWMVAAHQSNLSENAASAQATPDTVRQLGQMFVAMHTQLDADLTATATQPGVTLPESPTPAQQQALALVQGQQGAAFDAAWLASQVTGHRETPASDARRTTGRIRSDGAGSGQHGGAGRGATPRRAAGGRVGERRLVRPRRHRVSDCAGVGRGRRPADSRVGACAVGTSPPSAARRNMTPHNMAASG